MSNDLIDVSSLGSYVPPGPDVADGFDRESCYVMMADGCQLAVDVLRPTSGGERLGGERPTVLHATPYRRSFVLTGKGKTARVYQEALAGLAVGDLATQYHTRPLAKRLVHQGYNFVSVDLRGTGASFGADYVDSWRAGHDIAQVVGWIIDQPWATDRVGMVGISYEGMIQFYTAAFAPEGLVCIAPQYPGLPQCYVDGGLAISSFARVWEELHKGLAEHEPAAPVDGDDGLELRVKAEAERDPDRYKWVESFSAMAPEDVTRLATYDLLEAPVDRSDLGIAPMASGYTGAHDLLNMAGVPTYLSTGWWDLTFPGYLIDFYNRLSMPKKLLVGPWNHGQAGDAELLRWLDHCLRGDDNGVLEEPPVHFATSEPSGATVWKSTSRLPLPEAQLKSWYLAPGAELLPTTSSEADVAEYRVDHDVTLGPLSRHSYYVDDLYINTPDLDARADRCLTFATAPLEHDVEITGAPALELDLTTDADRGAVMVTLEQLMADGSAAYLTEGFLNFAHRRVSVAELGHDGPVWHSHRRHDLLPVEPGEPMAVSLELYPISCLVRAGDRLRLTVAGADADNLIVPTIGIEPTLRVTLGGNRASRLLLPVVNPNVSPTASVVEGAFPGDDAYAFRRSN